MNEREEAFVSVDIEAAGCREELRWIRPRSDADAVECRRVPQKTEFETLDADRRPKCLFELPDDLIADTRANGWEMHDHRNRAYEADQDARQKKESSQHSLRDWKSTWLSAGLRF